MMSCLQSQQQPLPFKKRALPMKTIAGLRTLNLRQNILPDAAVLNSCQFKGALQDLELRDNLLTAVRLHNTIFARALSLSHMLSL